MTAVTDIAAIDDGGANTPAEVRTALTATRAERFWEPVVDDDLSTVDSVTTYAGTWSIVDGALSCAIAAGGANRVIHDTNVASAIAVVQADFEMPAGITDQTIAVGLTTGNVDGSLVFGYDHVAAATSSVTNFFTDATAGIGVGQTYPDPTTGDWVTIQFVRIGLRLDGYVNGVLQHSRIRNQLVTTEDVVYPFVSITGSTGISIRLRNLRCWNPRQPA